MCKVLMGKTEGMRPLGRPRRRSEDGIRMDLRNIGWGDWIRLAQDWYRWRAVVNAVMNLRVLAPRSSSRQNFTVQNSPERAWTQAQRQDILLSVTFPC
jgi:hypothetical protein